jgi:DNA-directed RNA polymerase II subunit RPB7
MFFVVQLEKDIVLEPKYLGQNIRETLTAKLKRSVEGTCTYETGYILSAYQIEQVDKGRVMHNSGSCTFRMQYHAIVFKPLKDEVIDAEVERVQPAGFICKAGPASIFVVVKNLPKDMKFEEIDSAPAFVTSDSNWKISIGSLVRVKIIGTTLQGSEINCVGKMDEDFLGLIG